MGSMISSEPQQKKQKVDVEARATFPLMSEAELERVSVAYEDDEAFSSKLKDVLQEHGMAVVKDVLTEDECVAMENMWKREMAEESALPRKEISEPVWWANVWLHAHGEFAWRARLHPRVQNTFACVFDTKDLACGFDVVKNFCVADGKAQTDNRQWLHVDQNTCTGITDECYQGILYLWHSAGEDRSTTVIWPGSHKQDGTYGRLIEDPSSKAKGSLRNAYGIPFGHYIELNQLEAEGSKELVDEALNGARRVPVPRGALLLWSSRAVHQGWAGGPRLAVPICWEPKDRVSPEARQRKMFMAAAGFPSTHSPSEALVHPCIATRRGDKARMQRTGVRPFSVLPAKDLPDSEWDELWRAWEGEQFAEDLLKAFDPSALEKALKPEILAAI
mmetsp:Transcript_158091/g.279137  ORF Transcript_158091/g.279137 Transcript_158091/m.279137 type:complete len:390 (+) Transcript_158091:67-1236(+)